MVWSWIFCWLFFCFLIATLGIRIFLTVIKGGRVYLFLSICNCNNALIYFGSDILDLKTNMRSPSRYCTIISGGVITWLMVGLTYGLFLGCRSSGWPACKSCCLNNSYFYVALIKSTSINLQKSDLSQRQRLSTFVQTCCLLDHVIFPKKETGFKPKKNHKIKPFSLVMVILSKNSCPAFFEFSHLWQH